MPERTGLPRQEIVVATAHDLLMTPYGGEPHELHAPREEDVLDLSKIIRASEVRVPRQMVDVVLESGARHQVPIFEVRYTGLENAPDMRRLMAGLAVDQVVVASRLGGRYLHRTGIDVQDKFGHPAGIIRDPATGVLLSAERIGVPQPVDYQGPIDLRAIDRMRPLDNPVQLVNYLPEDMYLQADGELQHVANCGYVADVDYNYEPMGQTDEGVIIAKSTPTDVTGMPEQPATDELRLVHTEVLFESLRLGIASPEEASRMVIACGVRRAPSGHQGNVFTSLAYFSPESLHEIYERIKI